MNFSKIVEVFDANGVSFVIGQREAATVRWLFKSYLELRSVSGTCRGSKDRWTHQPISIQAERHQSVGGLPLTNLNLLWNSK